MGVQVESGGRTRHTFGVFILIVAVFGPATLYAQAPVVPATQIAALNDGSAGVDPEMRTVRLLVGRSAVVDVGTSITRVSLTSPDIADALVTAPSELLINGKMPGTISMFVWDRSGALRRYEIAVQRDLAGLTEQLKMLFPGEAIDAHANGRNIVLSGTASSKDVVEKTASLAGGFVDKKEEVISLVQLAQGAPTNQVLLRVRFAEVNRSALTELGLGLFTSPTGIKNTIGRVTTGQFPAPDFSELQATKQSSDFGSSVASAAGKFTFSDFLNLFLFSQKYDLGAVIKALQTKGLFQSLAEPNLVAESGKEASFLAGGEFPIPVAQGSSSGTAITVQFKEFGIRLTFTPVVTGNRIHLKIRPEVSTLDFASGVTLQGFRIPALITRRTETELELENGQTFAVAGLMNNTLNSTLQKIPGIGDIPILGLLFKSKAAQKNQTELVVMITPEILPNNSSGVTPNLPRLVEPYLPPVLQKQTIEPPPPAFRPAAGGQAGNPVPANTTATATPAAGTENAQKAAAAMSALSPGTRAPNVHAGATPAAPEAPAPSATPATASGAEQESPKPLTAKQQKALERTQKHDQEVAARANAEAAKRAAQAAKKQAALDEKQQKAIAEAAKKQAALDKKQQKAIAESERPVQ